MGFWSGDPTLYLRPVGSTSSYPVMGCTENLAYLAIVTTFTTMTKVLGLILKALYISCFVVDSLFKITIQLALNDGIKLTT